MVVRTKGYIIVPRLQFGFVNLSDVQEWQFHSRSEGVAEAKVGALLRSTGQVEPA
jgi:hypothetical protein